MHFGCLPLAITVSGPGRMYFDLEFVPTVVDRPRDITLTVNPGFLWRLGHGFAAGSRVGFDIRTSSFGITPLVVKSFPIEHRFLRAYFIETDSVFRFDRPPDGRATNPFNFNMVFGLAFLDGPDVSISDRIAWPARLSLLSQPFDWFEATRRVSALAR